MIEDIGNAAETAQTVQARRGGFSLVEVVVAMVMLAVVVSSLGYLTTITAQRSVLLANTTGRQAFVLQETNRIASIPYDSIPSKVGCDTVAVGQLQYRRCISYTAATRARDAQVVITPLKAGTYPDTIVVRRAATTTINPLFTP